MPLSLDLSVELATLSGWSWPSRQIAYDMARNFKLNGDSSVNDTAEFSFDYLTPHNHPLFIDAIVQSDLNKVKSSIRKALAVSLRVDGSVDRTGDHNVYVLAHIMDNDFETSTLFMGFGVPQTDGAEGYFECVKKVVSQVLPWSEFFDLVTSVVTDGEPLNMGSLTGLCARLKDERLKSAFPLTPLHCLWCVPHRINLAWKSTCNNQIINSNIIHCRKIAKYFRISGVRTKKLKAIAKQNHFSKLLRFPAFFAIRWTEYVYNLLNAVLRNYRAVMKYCKTNRLHSFLNIWESYDRIHFIAFLADVLGLLKKFQKSCQSNNICIVDVPPLRKTFIDSLEKLKNYSFPDGWEQLFLGSIVHNQNKIYIHGIRLLKTTSRRSFEFSRYHRQRIIQTLVNHVNIRIDFDSSFRAAIEPLVNLSPTVQQNTLKACHNAIAEDFDQESFLSDYKLAGDLLDDESLSHPKEYLESLKEKCPERLHTIKVALARILTLKPNSADVERLISVNRTFNIERGLKNSFKVSTISSRVLVVPPFYLKRSGIICTLTSIWEA